MFFNIRSKILCVIMYSEIYENLMRRTIQNYGIRHNVIRNYDIEMRIYSAYEAVMNKHIAISVNIQTGMNVQR